MLCRRCNGTGEYVEEQWDSSGERVETVRTCPCSASDAADPEAPPETAPTPARNVGELVLLIVGLCLLAVCAYLFAGGYALR